jgi:hypothetical protein
MCLFSLTGLSYAGKRQILESIARAIITKSDSALQARFARQMTGYCLCVSKSMGSHEERANL